MMVGYIFETTNKKTGETYLGKRYGVTFDKNYFGDSDDVAIAIEKYGKPSFEVKMLRPCDSIEEVDAMFEEFAKSRKPAKKAKVEEEATEEVKPARKRKAVEE